MIIAYIQAEVSLLDSPFLRFPRIILQVVRGLFQLVWEMMISALKMTLLHGIGTFLHSFLEFLGSPFHASRF